MFKLGLYIRLFSFNNYFWAAAIPAIAGIAGAMLTNKSNAKQAQNQMDFQQQNSDTAYQRSMSDMKAAGLNPILAAKLGGASTPSGAMAQMQNPVTSAFQGSQISSDIDLKEANTTLTKTKETLTKQLIPGAEAVSTLAAAGRDLIQGLDKMIKGGVGSYGELPQKMADTLGEVYNKAKQLGGTYFENVQRLLDQELKKFDEVLELIKGDTSNSKAKVR